jgi:hypothetical protein
MWVNHWRPLLKRKRKMRLRLIPSITQFIAYAYITDSILLGGEGTQTL